MHLFGEFVRRRGEYNLVQIQPKTNGGVCHGIRKARSLICSLEKKEGGACLWWLSPYVFKYRQLSGLHLRSDSPPVGIIIRVEPEKLVDYFLLEILGSGLSLHIRFAFL